MQSLTLRRLDSSDCEFDATLSRLIRHSKTVDSGISDTVREIISKVRQHGDKVLLGYVARHDGIKADDVASLRVTAAQIAGRAALVEPRQGRALEQAAARIETFAQKQKMTPWEFEEDGVRLGQHISALESVGIYVPGGKASYPSSVLMNAIPALVAGVERIVAATPANDGVLNPLVARALQLANVNEVYAMGGAQAIAALAYGTETIAAVKKITGPGNAYVAEAKRQVYGEVGIDMLAGPSEILIISDGTTDPAWIARDLFSQAEHDEMARAMLLCDEPDYFDEVSEQMEVLIEQMPRRGIIVDALTKYGVFIKVVSLDEAVEVANRIAPEHLQLSVKDSESLLPKVRNAGAVFLGSHTSEVLGDYCAGPNHVLPTNGAAHFSSPLGVYDFQKRTNTICCSPESAARLGEIAKCLAQAEGLAAHAEAAHARIREFEH